MSSIRSRQDSNSEKVYLPAEGAYGNNDAGIPIDQEIQNYITREFPLPSEDDHRTMCYQIPKEFVQHGEKQGSLAEYACYERICHLKLPDCVGGSLWLVCFQGISYAGRSFKQGRFGGIMTREHDFVLFAIHKGNYFVSLIEVKSTCDDPLLGYKTSDAIGVKNNKRSGQHQLRDHLEILKNACQVSEEQINSFLFWPFLSMWTIDPKGNRAKRWEQDVQQHVFRDVLSDQMTFNDWFYRNVLCAKAVDKIHFDNLFKRFIVLSCGIFVNEIHDGMLALLSQEQVNLMYTKPCQNGHPTIVHGAAGTGKTLLVLHKIQHLYEHGLIDENNRALYICYWPGIRADFKRKLEKLNISQYVDTMRFFISQDIFMQNSSVKYRHIFMDECEAICLAFSEIIVTNTFTMIEKFRLTDFDPDFQNKQEEYYHVVNSSNNTNNSYGDLWFLVDINQATLFMPKFSPSVLKKPTITLSKVMRNTGTIYGVFSQFYKNPLPKVTAAAKLSDMYLNNIKLGHEINGPPIYWVDSKMISEQAGLSYGNNKTFNGLVRVVVDLYSTKGIRPNDMCVLPFFVTAPYQPDNVNKAITTHFVTNGYRPVCTQRVEEFLLGEDPKIFLLSWVLKVKGLEFKVVVMAIENDDFDCFDMDDRRKIYVMASRCTCLLIIVCNESVKDAIDVYGVMKAYPFGIEF